MNEEEWKDFYKRYPDKFIEMLHGVELYPYQKLLFRIVYKHKFSKFIDRYFTVMEQLKKSNQKDCIRGHRLESAIYEDNCQINKEAINEVLKPFMKEENNNV